MRWAVREGSEVNQYRSTTNSMEFQNMKVRIQECALTAIQTHVPPVFQNLATQEWYIKLSNFLMETCSIYHGDIEHLSFIKL